MAEHYVHTMRQAALSKVESATGGTPVRLRSQTYRTPAGTEFHLRTRQRDEQAGGWIRYWFGIRDSLWQPEDFFVLVCDLDFVLVVPVEAWLPYMDQFSISRAGTPEQARQPHIYWSGSTYVLREASRSLALELDVRPWLNQFGLLG